MGRTIRFESAAVASSVLTRPPMHMPRAMNETLPSSTSGSEREHVPDQVDAEQHAARP